MFPSSANFLLIRTPDAAQAWRTLLAGGARVEVQTDDPTDLLHRLTGDALTRGERLEGLEVARPSLEDVYLQLTAEEAAEGQE